MVDWFWNVWAIWTRLLPRTWDKYSLLINILFSRDSSLIFLLSMEYSETSSLIFVIFWLISFSEDSTWSLINTYLSLIYFSSDFIFCSNSFILFLRLAISALYLSYIFWYSSFSSSGITFKNWLFDPNAQIPYRFGEINESYLWTSITYLLIYTNFYDKAELNPI